MGQAQSEARIGRYFAASRIRPPTKPNDRKSSVELWKNSSEPKLRPPTAAVNSRSINKIRPIKGGTSSSLNPRRRKLLPHPTHKLLRRLHRRQPPLPHQRPIVKQSRLLDLPQRHRWLQPLNKLKIRHRRLRILRILAPLLHHLSQPHHRRQPSAVINEHLVARLHLPDRAHCLWIVHPVPNRLVLSFKLIDRVSLRIRLREKVFHNQQL